MPPLTRTRLCPARGNSRAMRESSPIGSGAQLYVCSSEAFFIREITLTQPNCKLVMVYPPTSLLLPMSYATESAPMDTQIIAHVSSWLNLNIEKASGE